MKNIGTEGEHVACNGENKYIKNRDQNICWNKPLGKCKTQIRILNYVV